LTQRALTRAYHHWSYHTAVQGKAKARRHHTTQQQGQLARFKARLATMAVQRVARVLVSHWTKWAFHAWRRNVRTWRRLARMLHTMQHAVMHRRWACWCRHAALHRARRRSLAVVLARYGTANLGLYWRGWCAELAEFRREQQEHTTRARQTSSALLFWRQHHVRKYVHTWHRHARDAARARQHLRLCLRRMASLALRRCFVQWRSTMKVKSVFIVHVGGTRCVTSSTDNIMNIHARITLTVEFIRGYIFIFLLYVEIQLRV